MAAIHLETHSVAISLLIS